MTKAKSKATVMVADGSGGMTRVQDRRFEQGDWPFRFEVPSDQADLWLRYFHDECQRRGWGAHSFSQMEARENSGSTTVTAGGADAPSLGMVWERKRDRAMLVRARSAGALAFPDALAQSLFDEINRRHAAGAMERLYRRSQLAYEGLAWRGELWLDDTLRLGPPSRQDDMYLLGPRIVIVDALVDCVGQSECAFVFENKMRELSAFLTVVLGISVQMPEQGRAWTWVNGVQDCDIRQLGYLEQNAPQEIPTRGSSRAAPLRKLTRPDFSLRGIDGSTNEILPPEDITDLWTAFCGLTPDRRRQFLRAAAKWQEALLHWRDRSTLSFVLMVVACEVLRPPEKQYREHNIYQIVEALLGTAVAETLQEEWFRPQNIRNAHLHRGELYGSEFLVRTMTSSFYDPTFDQARRALARVAQEAIIEWLRKGGAFTMAPIEGKITFRRWMKNHALILVTVVAAVGLVLGWVLRMFWYR